jgi:hypothetical protein
MSITAVAHQLDFIRCLNEIGSHLRHFGERLIRLQAENAGRPFFG